MADERSCPACGLPFAPRRASQKYCSRTCMWSQNGKSQARTGSRWLNARGYVEVAIWRDGKQIRAKEHRLVAEQAMGRRLLPTEDVHHKNGIKSDNRPENLEVVDHARHTAEHTNRERAYRRGYKLHLSGDERMRRADRMRAVRARALIARIEGK